MKRLILSCTVLSGILFSSCSSSLIQPPVDKSMGTLPIGSSPTIITMEVEIDAPVQKVWSEFADLGGIYKNSPTVAKSHLSSESSRGIGATRHMEMAIGDEGATLDERVILWNEGEYMALEVYKIKGFSGVQTMGGDFRFIPKGDKTLFRSTLNYSMSNGFYGFMNKVIMKGKFTDIWSSVIAGYKHHIETGEEVTQETMLPTDQVVVVLPEDKG